MCRFPSSRAVYRDFSNAELPGDLEARTSVFDPETRENPNTAFILTTRKSYRHDWQTVTENPALQDSI